MKYPSVYLNGRGALNLLSIAVAGHNGSRYGCQMIHNAPETSSSIVSKSIVTELLIIAEMLSLRVSRPARLLM